MKLSSALSLVAAFSFSTTVFAQSETLKTDTDKSMSGMEMKKGMDSKKMTMKHCMDMKGMNTMDMKGMSMKDMPMKDMDMSKMDAQKCKEMMGASNPDSTSDHQAMHAADGVVKSVSPAGKVTLQHGAVKTLSWPAMTMEFAVKDKALLAKMPVGSKVHVEFSKQGSDYVIGSVK